MVSLRFCASYFSFFIYQFSFLVKVPNIFVHTSVFDNTILGQRLQISINVKEGTNHKWRKQ